MTVHIARYVRPTAVDALFNRVARRLVRFGVSLWGARELRVVGRHSGAVRSTVVNLLELGGERYLVAPRGETHWVRNLRAAGGSGELRTGRRVEAFVATEVAGDEKGPVLAAYLDRWAFEVKRFFGDGEVDPAGFPVFRIATPSAGAR